MTMGFGKVYRGSHNRRWQCYYQVPGTVSRRWPTRGQKQAASLILQQVWQLSHGVGEVGVVPTYIQQPSAQPSTQQVL